MDALVIGVDPGSRWTAAVLRHGDAVLHGWTLGPVDATGHPERTALDDVDDLHAMGRYVDRLTEALGELEDLGEREVGHRPALAVEAVLVPPDWRARRPGRMSMVDWLIPRQVVVGLCAVYPGALLVTPAGGKAGEGRQVEPYGKRRGQEYPAALRGAPPAGWGPVESRRRERDHERAAYDVAGVAASHVAPPVAAPERVA